MEIDLSWFTTDRIISILGNIVGWGLAIYAFIDNRKLSRKVRSYDWNDVMLAANSLAKAVKAYKPEVIYAPNPNGGILALQIRDIVDSKIPVITGATLWKEDFKTRPVWRGYHRCDTSKWHLQVPLALNKYAGQRLLIVDDYVLSGDGLRELVGCLKAEKFGFSENQIEACAMIVNETAFKTKKAPKYYWKRKEEQDFLFPWGPAR